MNSLYHDKQLITPSNSSWMLSTIAKSALILHRLNVQRTWVSVSVLLPAGKPSSEIMTAIFPLSVPVITLLKKRRKSLVLSVNSVMLRMHLIC